MTLSTLTNRVSFAGDGVTTGFSFLSKINANSDLVVILRDNATGVETPQVSGTDYNVIAIFGGGVVAAMVVAPPVGKTLTLYRDTPPTQELDLVDDTALPAENLETAYDKLSMIAQRARDLASRVIKLSEGFFATFNMTLPTVLTPDASLCVNHTGDGWVMGPSATTVATQVAQADADAAAAASSAAAASTSAATASGSATTASTQATNAAASATAAATQASNASTSAASAAVQATNAATSATNAAASATAAAANALSVKKVTGNTTMTAVDGCVLVDATGGPVAITLPLTTAAVKEYSVSKIDNTANVVTVIPQGVETIQRGASYTLSYQDDFASFIPFGGNFNVK